MRAEMFSTKPMSRLDDFFPKFTAEFDLACPKKGVERKMNPCSDGSIQCQESAAFFQNSRLTLIRVSPKKEAEHKDSAFEKWEFDNVFPKFTLPVVRR